jgi:hypothetical protein
MPRTAKPPRLRPDDPPDCSIVIACRLDRGHMIPLGTAVQPGKGGAGQTVDLRQMAQVLLDQAQQIAFEAGRQAGRRSAIQVPDTATVQAVSRKPS